MDPDGGNIRDLMDVFFGGQGTINAPSWSPDNKKYYNNRTIHRQLYLNLDL